MTYKTKDNDFIIRFAEEGDAPIILQFINELAAYENLLDQVVATEALLHQALFVQKSAEVIIGVYKNKPVGFALFFHNFSTFLGQAGIYLEDLYVQPEMRGKGLGKIMLSFLGKVTMDRGCGRLEWACLDWNEPAIKFYKQLGAQVMADWTVYRLTGENLARTVTMIK